jgi:hypothetical protein
MTEPVVADARIAPGHDGQAELVVQLRYENGALGSVTLDASCARKLMENCGVEQIAELRGQPWQRLLDVIGPSGPLEKAC